MRYIEPKRAWILFRCEVRLAAGQIFEPNLVRGNLKVGGKQEAQRRATSGKVNSVLLEVKLAGARDLIGREKVSVGACFRGLVFHRFFFRRLVEAHPPDVNAAGWKRRHQRSLRPRSLLPGPSRWHDRHCKARAALSESHIGEIDVKCLSGP